MVLESYVVGPALTVIAMVIIIIIIMGINLSIARVLGLKVLGRIIPVLWVCLSYGLAMRVLWVLWLWFPPCLRVLR